MFKTYDGPTYTRTSASALVMGERVIIDSSGNVAEATLTSGAVGTVEESASAAGESIAIRASCMPASQVYVASKAIAVGDQVFAAAAGKVSDTQGVDAPFLGYAISAAAADGDLVHVLRGEPAVT